MLPTFFDWLTFALGIAAISITISKTYIFKGFRNILPNPLKKMFSCPYCLAHWLSFLTVYYFIPCSVPGFIMLSFALIGLSSICALPIAFYLEFIDEDS